MKAKNNLVVACVVDNDISGQIRRGQATDTRSRYDLSLVEALRRLYRDVHLVSAFAQSTRTIDDLVRIKPDVVFNLAFSALSTEVPFVGCLEFLGIPYTGSGPHGLILANDKVRSRQLLRCAGIRVPQFIELRSDDPVVVDIRPPLIVKPASLGGSAGIHSDSIATTPQQVIELAKRIWDRFGVPAVCEEFIVGREFRVGLVETKGNRIRIAGISEWEFGLASPGWGFKTEAIRINPRVRRSNKVTRKLVELPQQKMNELSEIAQRSMRTLDLSGYATVDIRVDDMERVTVVEANPNPGLWSGGAIWSNPSFDVNVRDIVNAALMKPRR